MISKALWSVGKAASKLWSSAVPHLKAVAAWAVSWAAQAMKKKKKLVPGTAYKIAKPAAKAANKLKNMAASCQACSGK